MKKSVVLMAAGGLRLVVISSEPNPPTWPPSVRVFENATGVEKAVSEAYASNGGSPDIGQFSNSRFAFLFKPGDYDVEVPVGYYTQVLGLGEHPNSTRFVSARGVYCEEADAEYRVGALDTFWRGAENFQNLATYAWWDGAEGMLWAASQASPLRRIEAEKVYLYEYRDGDAAAGYASGGYLSDSKIATLDAGSQQQYCVVQSEIGTFENGAWNLVMVGVDGGVRDSCSTERAVTTVAASREPKPFIIFKNDRYYLRAGVEDIDFERVRVVDDDLTRCESFHCVLAPGVYAGDATMSSDGQILLGLGLATIRGSLTVTARNVRVAGLIIEALATPDLVTWKGSDGLAWDLFVRAGDFGNEGEPAPVETMMRIEGDRFVGDDFWLWRADHDLGNASSKVLDGLIVAAENVTFFGLAVEHAMRYQTKWLGRGGRVFFYQAELPYDAGPDFDYPGFLALEEILAVGVGVYSYFRDYPVRLASAIEGRGTFEAPLAVFLDGQGSISHVHNDQGPEINTTNRVSHVCGGGDDDDDDDDDDAGAGTRRRLAFGLLAPVLALAALAGFCAAYHFLRSIGTPPAHRRQRSNNNFELTAALVAPPPYFPVDDYPH